MAREARLRDRAVLSAFLVGDDIASSETTSSEMSVSTGEDGGPAAAAAEPSHPPMPNPMGPTPMDVIAHQMASLSAAELQQVVAHAASHMAHRSGSPCASPMAAAPLPLPGAYLQPRMLGFEGARRFHLESNGGLPSERWSGGRRVVPALG